ncbi:MAG: ElyC/SanA/YdcF family protein [Verrucomicrobiota bacterium]
MRSMVFRIVIVLLVLGIISVPLSILVSEKWVISSAKDRLYTEADQVPHRPVALVLGCAKILPDGRRNLFFIYRIQAAAELYHAGKCDYLIVSGDNSKESYDEPTDMRDALIEAGVPESKIYRDYAGFRTLDSVVRANSIFDQKSITLVSQKFHNERAIFIARQRGIDAIGLNCHDVRRLGGLKTKLRERLARVKTVLDVTLLRTQPKFLGEKVQIGGPVS